MAAKIDFDIDQRIVYVTEAPVAGTLTLDVQVDVYSDMKEDWRTNAALNKLKFPLSEPVGGNTVTPGKVISPYYFLKYGWTMRPYEVDHTLYLENGYLLLDGGGDPWNKTLGGYTVNVRDSIPADAYAIGSGTTPPTALEIADAVWDELASGHALSGSFGLFLQDILKLTGYKVTKTGDIITIYESDGNTTWRQYNLANEGRVQV